MTNFIEKLKQVAAGRHADPFDKDDKKIAFDELVDNCFDELVECVAVLEHAQELGYFSEGGSTAGWANEALEKLRQKVEGE